VSKWSIEILSGFKVVKQ